MIIRTRVGHSRTQKEGWKHETTVEITFDPETDNAAQVGRMYDNWFKVLDDMGAAEAARRNAFDEDAFEDLIPNTSPKPGALTVDDKLTKITAQYIDEVDTYVAHTVFPVTDPPGRDIAGTNAPGDPLSRE